jgi:hypothetical protein
MNKKTDKKFSWCPVCMIHTYHQKSKKDWECVNDDHLALLRFRTDPWIEQYRKARTESSIPAQSEV